MRASATHRRRGEAAVLLVVVLAILGAGIWYLEWTRRATQKQARDFAGQVAEMLAVRYDWKSLASLLSAEARSQYPPSWRDRLVGHLHDFGKPIQPIPIEGDVKFRSFYFDPHGEFRAQLTYPKRGAQLVVVVSHGLAQWQIEYLNLIWNPDPNEAPF